ncbi:hypothetical protein AWN76_007935 [Rhodothermaceae bacterium RA]|nr:hypothetical protein AWN76_007935 [Rhodothermaceae bacterium RA]
MSTFPVLRALTGVRSGPSVFLARVCRRTCFLIRPLPEADTPNTYRSEVTGMTYTCEAIGKVVFYLRPA